jgi:hypothetical protein
LDLTDGTPQRFENRTNEQEPSKFEYHRSDTTDELDGDFVALLFFSARHTVLAISGIDASTEQPAGAAM